MNTGTTIHRLKITLQYTKPPIWRRLEVPSGSTLADLHHCILTAFGWLGYHLHDFEVGEVRYGVDDAGPWGDAPADESTVTLTEVAPQGSRFTYTYDFGDNWEHLIEVEEIAAAVEGVSYPRCTAGRRAAPPEDVGGTFGYDNLVAALADPSHPGHDEMADLFGTDTFDPGYFKPDDINAAFGVHP